MIPDEEEMPKSLLESFAERWSEHQVMPGHAVLLRAKSLDILWDMVDEVLKDAFQSMDSWDEWHEYLSQNGIIPVKSRNPHQFHEDKWFAWAYQKKMKVRRHPNDGRNPAKSGEFLLVPEKTVEKMIALGLLEK